MRQKIGFVGGLGITLAVLGFSCGGSTAEGTGTSTSTAGGGGAAGGDACTAHVVVDLYADDQCTEPAVFSYTLDLGEACSGWSRQVSGTTRTDSASRFQCYRDRVCYTQYVDRETWDATASMMITDKESRTACLKDHTPGIWTKIRSGTEGCPEAPAGFDCPSGQGTTGLAAACSGG